MEIKLLEIRDVATFIPMIAIKISRDDGYLARRAGYGDSCILLGKASGGPFCYDMYDWGNRTFRYAHDYIIKNYDNLKNGDVVDVEYWLGYTEYPKESEQLDYPA